ncbi:putative ABC transporter ATP-binding protein YbhF [bacterium BMS3Abin01]|nr:putative ABC transporter ATP-binding protein YbhF [bacterium BMS3Abin01]
MTDDRTIVCRDLTKYYGHIRGVEGLDLAIEPGEIFGFLGPNGAGKTTTIRQLMGMLRPTRGSASILGLDSWRDAVQIKLHVGNIPGDVHLYDRLKVGDHLDYIDRFRPGTDPLRNELMDRFELDPGKKVKSLSSGNRQKVAIVMAIMHDPRILILDEPTSGLDPLMQQEFYTLLEELRERGRTIFLSSHILSEVERVCDRVGIVRDGRLVDTRAIEELKQKKVRHMDVLFRDDVDPSGFQALPQVIAVKVFDNHMRITIQGDVDALIKQLARHDIEDLTFTQPSLEDFFMSFYGAAESHNE